MSDNKNHAADANRITREYMDSILIEQRLIDSEVPTLTTELFGVRFDTPVMMPAFSHLRSSGDGGKNAMIEYAVAARNLNALNFVGMCENEELDEIMATGAKTVRIVKPYADKDKIYSQLAYAEEKGAIAVGMDIDHIFGSDGQYDVVVGEKMTRQTTEDLTSYIGATKLPFVVKGVLSVRDAVKCAECGVSAILVSHHSGRMPYAVPPLMVLPDIVRELGSGNHMKIFVDCGIASGADVYKALALGANAAAVGRAMLPSLLGKGAEGVESYVRQMNQELAYIMGFTGCGSVNEMDSTVLRFL